MGWMIRGSSPGVAGNFSLHHRVQTGSGAHPASYPLGTTGFFPGGKSGRGVKLITELHLVPRSKNEWSYTSTPQYAFMAWFSVKAQGQLYIYFYTVFKFLPVSPVLPLSKPKE
jgi:hypothetical protein